MAADECMISAVMAQSDPRTLITSPSFVRKLKIQSCFEHFQASVVTPEGCFLLDIPKQTSLGSGT